MNKNIRIAKEILRIAKELAAGKFDEQVKAGKFDESVTAGKFDENPDYEKSVKKYVEGGIEWLLKRIQKANDDKFEEVGGMSSDNGDVTFQISMEQGQSYSTVTLVTTYSIPHPTKSEWIEKFNDTSTLTIKGNDWKKATNDWLKKIKEPMINLILDSLKK